MNLNIQKLEIKIKEFHLHSENLSFEQGEVLQLAEPNGTGKSMFLKGLTGLVKTQHRIIEINGNDVNKLNLSDYIGAYLGEEFLIPFYEPLEYFQLLGKIKGIEGSQLKSAIENISNLFNQKWPTKYIRELSTGMRKKVGLAASLIGEPKIILCDEPFENIDYE
jgi:ABC-2 type transport system ATP-binding protein